MKKQHKSYEIGEG